MGEKCAEPCAELARLEQRLESYHAQNSASHQLMYDRLRDLETSDAVQKEQYNTILAKLDSLAQKADALEAKPAKRWDGLVDKALWAVAAALIAFLLARAGL